MSLVKMTFQVTIEPDCQYPARVFMLLTQQTLQLVHLIASRLNLNPPATDIATMTLVAPPQGPHFHFYSSYYVQNTK